jgi:GT2 family glycosyltransferase
MRKPVEAPRSTRPDHDGMEKVRLTETEHPDIRNSMQTSDVSIIITTWNSKDLVIAVLRSIVENVKGISFEVILVVNGSKDGTQGIVKELFQQVIVIDNEENLGFTKANNIGIQRARGKHILLLNDDTIVLPGSLEQMAGYLSAHEDTALVGPQLLHRDGSKQNCIHNFPSILNEIIPTSVFQIAFPRLYPSKRMHYEEPVDVQAVTGACMMVRREAIEKVGLLDEGFFSYLEETDWHLRMRQAGYRIVHIPSAEIYHVQGASSKKRFPGQSSVEYYRSLYHFFQKHYGTRAYQGLLAIKWIGLAVNVPFLFLLCLLTGFRRKRLRARMQSYAYLLAWHWKGRPAHMGLRIPHDDHG